MPEYQSYFSELPMNKGYDIIYHFVIYCWFENIIFVWYRIVYHLYITPTSAVIKKKVSQYYLPRLTLPCPMNNFVNELLIKNEISTEKLIYLPSWLVCFIIGRGFLWIYSSSVVPFVLEEELEDDLRDIFDAWFGEDIGTWFWSKILNYLFILI